MVEKTEFLPNHNTRDYTTTFVILNEKTKKIRQEQQTNTTFNRIFHF